MITAHYRVMYGDTDQMGVVYYANYLRIFEFARAHFMRACSLPYSEIERMGVLWPVAEAHVRYLRPAHFEDLLAVDTAITRLGRAGARFAYRVRRDQVLVATGWSRHACIDRTGKIVRIPDAFRSRLQVTAEEVFTSGSASG